MSGLPCNERMDCTQCPKAVENSIHYTHNKKGFHLPPHKCETWNNDGKWLAAGFCQSLSGTSGVVTYLSRVEGSARAYGHDPDGARHGS